MKKKKAQVTRRGLTKKKAQVTRRGSAKKKIVKGGSLAKKLNLPNINWKVISLLSLLVFPFLMVTMVRHWIEKPENLMIKSVEIKGNLKYLDRLELQPIIEPFVKTNLYLLDKENLENEIEFNHWVYSASLTSMWPDKLVIKIHEQQPIAFWGNEGMINEFGEVIDVDLPQQRNKLPMLYSPFDKGREMVESYVKIRQWMKNFPVDIVKFTEDKRGSWLLTLANGIKVKVGRQEHERRLRRFIVGYSNRLVGQVKKIDTVDLRYTNGFAVKWI
ncbi:MAG TPA: FtsQ-type POTRA domain-containing protein [Gammaproteobacteria bacterium]|nr:FtsQ-type POTRA domain-containing protein [Gammaproteobacteria bacterium]